MAAILTRPEPIPGAAWSAIHGQRYACAHVGEVRSRRIQVGDLWYQLCWDCAGRALRAECRIAEEVFERGYWEDWH